MLKSDSAKRYLRISLGAGIVYDLAFAFFIVFSPSLMAKLFDVPAPKELIYLKLNAVFLLMLCGFYFLAFIGLEQYPGVVTVAIAGRFLGGIYFLIWVFGFGAAYAFIAAAAGDVFFASLHLIFFVKSGLDFY